MPTDEELQAAVTAAIEKTKTEAQAEVEEKVKAAANGKFTQDDMDRVAGESRKDGRSVAERELLKSLGVSDLDAAKAALQAAKDAEDAQKTDLERVQQEAAQLKERAEAAEAEARNARISSALSVALRDADINTERASAAMRLVDLSKLEVEGADVKGLDEVVKGLKAESPEWFGTKTFSPPNASQSGNNGVIDYRTASVEERDRALQSHNIRL